MPMGSLSRVAAAGGRSFGTAVRPEQLTGDARLAQLVLDNCAAITPEIHFKWNAIEYAPGQRNFAPADALAAFAGSHGLALRGHALIWEQSTPDWALRRLAKGEGWELVEAHFAAMLGRYGAAAQEWDVVNEPIDTEQGVHGLRTTSFYRAGGPHYIERALHLARRLAPQARLAINDYSVDYDNPVDAARRTALLRLVERLKKADVPLDAVGLQAHLDLAKGPFRPQILRTFLADLAGLGVTITITELDVKEADRRAPLALRDARVAAEAQSYVATALEQPAVRGVTTWGLSDRDSWLQDAPGQAGARPERLNRGLPFDAALAPKPMYWAMRDAFAAG